MRKNVEILNSCGRPIPRQFLTEFDFWLRSKLAIKSKSIKFRNEKFQKSQIPLLKKNIVVAFMNRAGAKDLNQRFLGRDYATDVLSFAPIEEASIGELIFCFDVIKDQAKEHGYSFRDELAYMYIHGFLHLLGFEHEKSKTGARQMFELQDSLFDAHLHKRSSNK